MTDTLASFQQEFAGFLLQEELELQPALNAMLLSNPTMNATDPRRIESGLRVYRNNVIYSLIQALSAQFPVVKKLVGPDFFGALARDYVRTTPPLEPSLTYYGHQFSRFIETHPACLSLPYLADVATLELQCQRALHAADEAVLEIGIFAALPPQQLSATVLSLHPSAYLFTSNYPVGRIWAVNVEDSQEEIRLDSGSQHYMLVYRRELEVQVVSLQPAAYGLLLQLQLGKCLHQACALIHQEHGIDEAELAQLLGYLLGLGVFSRFTLQADEEPS